MADGVSGNSTVNQSRFATTVADSVRILERYKRIAMVGLSSNPFRPSHFAAIYLLSEGYDVIPVNPREKEVLKLRCYSTLLEVPGSVDIVDIFREPAAEPGIVEEAITIGAKVVWMQLRVIPPEAPPRARDPGLEALTDPVLKIAHAPSSALLPSPPLN